MILDEKLFINESNSKRLTYNEFVDYLDSIDNGYHAFSKVSGEMGSGYRYVLSNKLTQEQKDYLAQYSNVQIGDAKYKYAPEIKYDTVILLDRMSKTSLVKEEYDEDFFYTYEAIRHGESVPNRKYSGDFENEEDAVELAKDDEYDEVVRYTYDFISDNFDDYYGIPPRRIDTIWTKESGYINEDIVKTSKGKWVNKGKEGTHGEFKTKKAARAQQKAMYAQGWKGESLDESKGVIRKYKGYTLHDTGDSITITDPHGKTVGTERTEIGAEGLIDELVDSKDIKENIDSNTAEYTRSGMLIVPDSWKEGWDD